MGSLAPGPDPRWKQTSPGRYTRPLDCCEAIVNDISTSAHFTGRSGIITFSVIDYSCPRSSEDLVPVFKRAWEYLHAKYPHFAAFVEGEEKVYDVKRAQGAAEETFLVVYVKTVEEIREEEGYYGLMKLYILPHLSKAMIVAPHQYTDTIGIFLFWKEFLEMVEIIFKDQNVTTKRNADPLQALCPSFNEIGKTSWSEEAQKAANEEVAIMVQHADGLGAQNLERFEQAAQGKGCSIGIQFSEGETQAFIAAVKSRGWTVTPVVHAAVALATNKFAHAPDKCLSAFIPVDFRRYKGKHGETPLTSLLGESIRAIEGTNFNSMLQSCLAAYSTLRPNFDLGISCAVNSTLHQLATAATERPPPNTCVIVSSPGRADDYIKPRYGDIEIDKVDVHVRELLTMISFILLTFRGKFRAVLTYNDYFQRTEDMRRFAGMVKTEMLGAFGIPQEILTLE